MSRFKAAERTGWTERAAFYDTHFAPITRQALDGLIEALAVGPGTRLLDIGCGTGDLAARSVARGADVTGIDVASTMVAIARAKVLGARFLVGDAEALGFGPATFDAVACAFCVWHLAEPDRAFAEAARVLRTGGAFGFTTWLPPDEGWDMFALLQASVAEHGSLDVDLPPAPPPFRFAHADEVERSLHRAGFTDVRFTRRIAYWRGGSGADLLELIDRAIVRAPMLIAAQEPAAQARIKDAIRQGAEKFREDACLRMRWPYALVTASRA